MQLNINKTVKSFFIIVCLTGLAACSKQESKKTPTANNNTEVTNPSAPAAGVAAESLGTNFEVTCDGEATPVAASTAAVYDISACQLNNAQRAMIEEIGPLKVDASCNQRSIVFRNQAGETVGSGELAEDGGYSVALALGEHFSFLEGAPVDLQGVAAGSVQCNQSGTLASVDVTTAYNLSPVGATPSAPAALEIAPVSGVEAQAEAAVPVAEASRAFNEDDWDGRGDRRGDEHDRRDRGDRHDDRDHRDQNRERAHHQGGQNAAKGAGKLAPLGKQTQAQVSAKTTGKVEAKTAGAIPPVGQESPKGAQTLGKKGGQFAATPRQSIDFTPCAFNTHASLSCTQ